MFGRQMYSWKDFAFFCSVNRSVCVYVCVPAVKEKGESKPRQHTIDLSQMAVPIQLAQEKKPSPESPRPSTSEAEPSPEPTTAGTRQQHRAVSASFSFSFIS